MRLLFSVNNFGFLRNFEPALHQLAARGHRLHLLAERKDSVGGTRTIENLERAHPERVTWSYAPSRKQEPWQALAVGLRLCLDYWRYLDARYARAGSLRARAARQAPRFASRLVELPAVGSAPAMTMWKRLFRSMERAMPPGEMVERVLREQAPDLLLVTPLLYFGSQQVEYVRAARKMGIPAVLAVGSWDHLTTKGLIHEVPDRVIVWNEAQRREAAELHGVPPDRVTVTGAQAYDHWFTQHPSTPRATFCARVGLPDDRPVILYLCSSPFITPYEVGFVRRWVEAVRASADPDLRRAALLVRPHPQNADQWRGFDASFDEALSVWPRAGANPVDVEARAEYYDSMFHSAAVVGVNTSGLIESGIVGRPVFTVLADEFAGQQDDTLHFQHLKTVNGGLLTIARTLAEHVGQLGAALRDPQQGARARAFVEGFVRPLGLEVRAADRFADAVEAAAGVRPSPARADASAALWRAALIPVARAARAARPKRKAHASDDKDAPAAPRSALRMLFVVGSPEYLRYFDSTMTHLVEQGHEVSVAVNALRERKHARLAELSDPRIAILGEVPRRRDRWAGFARGLRGTMDFVRYLDPRFAGASALRARMQRKALPRVLHPIARVPSLPTAAVAWVVRRLRTIERAVPIDPTIARFLSEARPDVLVVSPLVDAASPQVDLVRAARAAGIPVAAAIASWDNLTNKGLLRVEPDLITVWNETQKEEAVSLHGVSPERVAVTGAQLFDRWFDRRPNRSAEAFRRGVGLPADGPFLLFTGSSVFIARSEVEVAFVRRWLTALRRSADPGLRQMPVLVRPHPFNADAWSTADLSDLGPVAVWPRQRYTPAAEEARATFFDSLYHCAGVVGINTSAMIEAVILHKPVFAVTAPEFAGTQEGTLHFRYLLPEHGGFLHAASTLEAHVAQLRAVLADPDAVRERSARFVESFLRPHGVRTPCTPVLAARIERLARGGATAVEPDQFRSQALRMLLSPIAAMISARGAGGKTFGPLKARAGGLPSRVVSRGRRVRKGVASW